MAAKIRGPQLNIYEIRGIQKNVNNFPINANFEKFTGKLTTCSRPDLDFDFPREPVSRV